MTNAQGTKFLVAITACHLQYRRMNQCLLYHSTHSPLEMDESVTIVSTQHLDPSRFFFPLRTRLIPHSLAGH